MALVTPLAADANSEAAELAKFFNETLGFCPNSVLTVQRRPAIAKAFIQLNMAVMENHGRVTSALKRLIGYIFSGIKIDSQGVTAAALVAAGVRVFSELEPEFSISRRALASLLNSQKIFLNRQYTLQQHGPGGSGCSGKCLVSFQGWHDK